MYSLSPFQIALHLYDKYVDDNADLCINISFLNRKNIYRYFQDISMEQNNVSLHEIELNLDDSNQMNNKLIRLYHIFDEAFTEIWRLIQTDSFMRFKCMLIYT